MAKILLVDDEAAIRRTLKEILQEEGYEVDDAKDGFEALVAIKRNTYNCVLLDIKMPKMDGMEALDKILMITPDVPVIMISGHATIDTAVEAVKKGAFDFISKPPDLNRLLITIKNALDKGSLVVERKVLKKRIKNISDRYEIIGESTAIKTIKANIAKIAPTKSRVLITGSNGTGKELVARAIHNGSDRSDQPFIEVNCAAIPSDLIESELFGHEKGAFTSAVKQHIGKFEQANGGTIFLDEIGDMSLPAQAKVLRALQENTISRVGGDKEIKVDVRVLAATNKDVKKEILAGRFREDLYHRINVIPIHVPPLKDRKDDIPLLSGHFIDMICREQGIPSKKISKEAIAKLQENEWTGNIRELRNVMERLIIMCGHSITEADVLQYISIPRRTSGLQDKVPGKQATLEDFSDFLKGAIKEFENLNRR